MKLLEKCRSRSEISSRVARYDFETQKRRFWRTFENDFGRNSSCLAARPMPVGASDSKAINPTKKISYSRKEKPISSTMEEAGRLIVCALQSLHSLTSPLLVCMWLWQSYGGSGISHSKQAGSLFRIVLSALGAEVVTIDMQFSE